MARDEGPVLHRHRVAGSAALDHEVPPAGAIRARPRSTRSPSSASLTAIAQTVQALAKRRRECSGMCCTMTRPGDSAGSTRARRAGLPSRPSTRRCRRSGRSRPRRVRARAAAGRHRPRASLRRAVAAAGCRAAWPGRPHAPRRRPAPWIRAGTGGCRPAASAVRRRRPPPAPRTGSGTRLGLGRADDHRERLLRHDLSQEGQAVHARHFEIEDDDVRDLLLDPARGDERIGRGTQDFDVGRRLQDAAQGLADGGRVVDDEDADRSRRTHRPESLSLLKTVEGHLVEAATPTPAIDSEWPTIR